MWPVPCRRVEARLHGRACTMLVHTPSPHCQPAANSQKVSAGTRTCVMGIRHVRRGASCRGSRVEGTHEGVRASIHAKKHGRPMLRRARVIRRIPRPKAWYYSLLALLRAAVGGGSSARRAAGHAIARDKACDIRDTHRMAFIRMPEERDPRVSLGNGSPTQQALCENYACCATPLPCSTRCYTCGCCWASNMLPRLLAICHGCSEGGLVA